MRYTIADAIMFLYPKADSNVHFQVMDHLDGKGPQIVTWNLEEPIPSGLQIQNALEALEQGHPIPKRESAEEKIVRLEATVEKMMRRLDANEGATLALMDFIP